MIHIATITKKDQKEFHVSISKEEMEILQTVLECYDESIVMNLQMEQKVEKLIGFIDFWLRQ